MVVLTLLAPVSAAAQLQLSAFELSFSNPGGRSLGLGGAFVALADDATAAYANPAGLVQLAKPEISVEGRSWGYTTTVPVTGRAEGFPAGFGLDTSTGARQGDFAADLTELSFLSFVLPMEGWAVAFYRHQLGRFESAVERQGFFGLAGSRSGLLPLGVGSGPAGNARSFAPRGLVSMNIVNHGVATGFRVAESLSLGFGVSYIDSALQITGAHYLPDDDSPESFFGESSYLPERLYVSADLRADGSDRAVNAGLLWKIDPRWGLGAFYRSGWRVRFSNHVQAGAGFPFGPVDVTGLGKIDFPSVYGLGAAFRSPSDRLTVAVEWDRVEYTKIVESFGDSDDAISDGDELHLGAEFVFLDSSPVVALRLGAWLDPDHRLHAESADPFVQVSQPQGDDEIHFAAGVGLVFKVLQVDFAVDLSEVLDTVSLSVVYTW